MTENEAIERLKCMRLFMQINDKSCESKFLEDDYVANETAIKALNEIQEYRGLGARKVKGIDDLILWINARRNAPLILSDIGADIAIKAFNEWKDYQALGTVEELREAMEKQRAKKPVFLEKADRDKKRYLCGFCGVGMDYYLNEEKNWKNNRFCPRCGNAIDWSVEE